MYINNQHIEVPSGKPYKDQLTFCIANYKS
jgi:hypothetical protein